MYPRNAASPERIAVGAVYLIADGTPQDTSVLVRVMPQGGAAAAGGGTLSVDATSHIWHYIPTQAETNYTSFMVMIYKASCTSACVTVVTTASSVPGNVQLAASQPAVTFATLDVTGACTHGSTVFGNTTMGTLTQTGAVSWGATTFASLTVSGTTSLQGVTATTIGATSITLTGTLQAATITSTGATTFNSLVVSTTTTLTGAVTAGTGVFADILADTNELQTDDIPTTLATLATAAELAKVPKSDGTASWNATALAAINAEADTALSDYDPPTKTELDTAFTEIKGATWASGTDTLEAIRDRGDAAWVTATSVTVSDKTGFSLASDGMDSVTLPADIITAASINTGAFTADAFAADALVAATFATDSISADALAADALAEINAQVVDVVRTDTATELAAVPAASPDLHSMVQFVYMAHRNKVTSTATASTVNNDAGSAIGTSTDADDSTTFTRGKYS